MSGDGLSVVDFEWSCPTCTFINKAGSFKCSVCSTPRGTSTRQVKFHLGTIEQQYAAECLSSSSTSSARGKKKVRGRGGGTSSNTITSKLRHSQCPWPKLDNIDRSNPVQKAITVNSITVLITEYNPLYPDSD
eukprot:Em0001g1127a